MNILLLDVPLFREEFRTLGHRVFSIGPDPACEVPLSVAQYTLEEIQQRLPADFRPDVLLLSESLKKRVLPAGLGNAPWPTAWYSIDGHLHTDWHLMQGRLFDHVLCTQLSVCREFQLSGQRADWLPWSVEIPPLVNSRPRDIAISMVGTFHRGHRARRTQVLERLRRRFPLQLFGPPYTEFLDHAQMDEVYARSQIVLNESICGELNFRLLEAGVNGACVLSDCADNGQSLLLQESDEFFSWTQANLESRLNMLLENPQLCQRTGHAARARIIADHSRLTRAQQLLELVQAGIENAAPRWTSGQPESLEHAIRLRCHGNGLADKPEKEPECWQTVPGDVSDPTINNFVTLEWLRQGRDVASVESTNPDLQLAILAQQFLTDLDRKAVSESEWRDALPVFCTAFARQGLLQRPGMRKENDQGLCYPQTLLQFLNAMLERFPEDTDLLLAHGQCRLDAGFPEDALQSWLAMWHSARKNSIELPPPVMGELALLQDRCGFHKQAVLTLVQLETSFLTTVQERHPKLVAEGLHFQSLLKSENVLIQLLTCCQSEPDSAALDLFLLEAQRAERADLALKALDWARDVAPHCSWLRAQQEQWKKVAALTQEHQTSSQTQPHHELCKEEM